MISFFSHRKLSTGAWFKTLRIANLEILPKLFFLILNDIFRTGFENVYLGFVLVPFCSMDGVFVYMAIILRDD